MEFGESNLLRSEGNTRLLEVGCRNNKTVYWVIGNGSTKHYDDYEDALEEFNLRWMREQYD